jgi:hypothetical protein
VVGAGVRPEWVVSDPGVRITGLRTYEGALDLTMSGTRSQVRVTLGGGMRVPRGGVIVRSPFDAPILQASVNGMAVRMGDRREVQVLRLPATVVLTY